jgi:creatinine amidohydrolase
MQWRELTSDAFPAAVKAAQGVCLLPMSCLERHGHHLPLGTDNLIGHELCRRAAALEPALVFPDLIFTQILEAQHYPGTIAIKPSVFLSLLDNLCAEIARNGCEKIILVSTHGGNDSLTHFFAQIQLEHKRDYVTYVASSQLLPNDDAAIKAQWETTVDGHAGEKETSAILAIQPELARLDQLPDSSEGMPLGRLDALRDAGLSTGIWWYADHPTHYCGDGHPATAEKGKRWLDARARALANAIRVVKQDTEARRLQDEFFGKIEKHRGQ